MKGNLSKKKGFLGKLEEKDLKSISDTLEVRFDERLTDAENSVLDITQTTIPNLKIDLNKYTDNHYTTYSNHLEEKKEILKESTLEHDFFEIFGLKLYYDDILLICLLFFFIHF